VGGQHHRTVIRGGQKLLWPIAFGRVYFLVEVMIRSICSVQVGNGWEAGGLVPTGHPFHPMKAVDTANCPTGEWPYEYVNAGPKYSICQDFSNLYNRVHGISNMNVLYNVLYQEGSPPTPTSGATITPPVPPTATPCAGPC